MYLSMVASWQLLVTVLPLTDICCPLRCPAASTCHFSVTFHSNSAQYRSLSLDQLCTMFEMDEKAVYSIVSKMMIAEELHGSWDQPTRTIVMHSIEASKVQSLAGQFADKATVSIESCQKC
jgi:hypothetical protein